MPFDRDDIKRIVKQFMNSTGRPSPFKENTPGIDWLQAFEKRHPSLSKQSPERLAQARAKNTTPEIVNAFFEIYEGAVSDHDMTEDQIWNCDETGLNKVFVSKGKKDVYLKSPTAGKTSYSVLVCGSASGKIMPPFPVFKGKNLYAQWTRNGPPNAGYSCSPSGWMHDSNFESWFVSVFVPSVKDIARPVVLLFDGHNSHLTYKTVKLAQENGILLICIPPHTSHRLQPLDVAFFRPFKMIWEDELKNWARTSKYRPVTKAVFLTLLKAAWSRITQKSVTGGFQGMLVYF